MGHFIEIIVLKRTPKTADKPIRIFLTLLLILSLFGISAYTHKQNLQESQEKTSIHQIDDLSYNTRSGLHLSEIDPPLILDFAINVTHSEGAGGSPRLRWRISDTNPDRYIVYRNGVNTHNGTYSGNQWISINLLNVPPGYYNYTLYANDTFGNFVTDTAFATIIDDTLPFFNLSPQDFFLSEGSSGNTISWSVSDLHPRNYNLLRNGVNFHGGTWNNSQPITISIDDLVLGIHNFTIEIFDESDNSAKDTVIIFVTDQSSPFILSSPANITFLSTTTGNNLILNAMDSHPNNYQIFQDEILVTNGTWSNDELITYNLDYLAYGNYTFLVILMDQFSNNVTVEIKVFVILLKETVLPQFAITSNVHEGDLEVITSQWKDIVDGGIANANITLSLIINGIINNTITFLGVSDNSGEFEFDLNYTGFPVGHYQWQIIFGAVNFESQELLFDFTVLPHNYAIFVPKLTNLIQGETYHIKANIYYANSLSSLTLNKVMGRSGAASNVDVDLFMTTTLLDGISWNISKTSFSNENGELDFTLTILETSLIASVNSIFLEIVGNEFGNSLIFNIANEDFPQIITTHGSNNTVTTQTSKPSENTLSVMFTNLESILIVVSLFSLFILLLIIRRIRENKRKKYSVFQDELNIALSEMKGLSTLQMIMLTSNTGIPLYERKLKTLGINSVLLSGMTNAISAVLQEINDQQIFGMEIMENRGLSITSHKAEYSNLIFISSQTLPMMILNRMIEIHEIIEKKYINKLTNTIHSGVGIFLQNDDMDDLFKNHNLKIELAGELEINLNKLEKYIAGAKKKNTERNFAKIFSDIDLQGNEILNVEVVMKILQERGHKENLAASYILKAYEFGIIS